MRKRFVLISDFGEEEEENNEWTGQRMGKKEKSRRKREEREEIWCQPLDRIYKCCQQH